LNSEPAADFAGAPLFAVLAKGACVFRLFICLVAITTINKKAGLNLSLACLLSKLCDDVF
jgi:hypothetical protein